MKVEGRPGRQRGTNTTRKGRSSKQERISSSGKKERNGAAKDLGEAIQRTSEEKENKDKKRPESKKGGLSIALGRQKKKKKGK